MSRAVRLIVLGTGNVGTALLQLVLQRSRGTSASADISVVAVGDSRSLLRSGPGWGDAGFSDAALSSIIAAKSPASSPRLGLETVASGSAGAGTSAVSLASGLASLTEAASAGQLKRTIVADCSASSETGLLLASLAEAGLGVVLANKKPLSESLELYRRLTAQAGRVRFESTVGAGLPVRAGKRGGVLRWSTLRACDAAFTIRLRFKRFLGALPCFVSDLSTGERAPLDPPPPPGPCGAHAPAERGGRPVPNRGCLQRNLGLRNERTRAFTFQALCHLFASR